MELNQDKILQLKKAWRLTWDDIAEQGNLNSRQHAFLKWKNKSVRAAEFFAKVFNMDPKDLIK